MSRWMNSMDRKRNDVIPGVPFSLSADDLLGHFSISAPETETDAGDLRLVGISFDNDTVTGEAFNEMVIHM